LFRDNQLKELNFPTLFYGHPRDLTIFKNVSCQQITQSKSLHKFKDFSTNISSIFLKTTKVSIQKVISFGWVYIRKGKLNGKSLKVFKV
jgi:hypothetical protein